MDLPLNAMSSKIWRRPRWSCLIVSFFAWHWFSHPQQMKLPLCWWSKDSISSISILLTFDFWLGMQEIPQGRNRTQVTPNVPTFLLPCGPCVKEVGMFWWKKSKCLSSRKWPSFDLDKLLVYIMRPNILILSSLQMRLAFLCPHHIRWVIWASSQI